MKWLQAMLARMRTNGPVRDEAGAGPAIMASASSPPGSMLTVREVFRPTSLPTITFIDRSGTKACAELQFYLVNTGGLVSVHGDSKSGKTTLCQNILKPYDPLLLHGRVIQTLDMFWDAVSARAGTPNQTEFELSKGQKRGSNSGGKASFGGDVYPFEISGEHKRASEETQDSKTKSIYSRSPQQILDDLIGSARPLIIDDFHSIPKDVQQSIVFSLKPAIDQGITVVVISIPEETKSIIQNMKKRGEAIGRHATYPAPLWQPEEIRQIPAKGFAALNVEIDRDSVEAMVRFSYRNPLLMQHYCSRLCFELGIAQWQAERRQFTVDGDVLRSVISSTAQQYEKDFSDYLSLDDGKNENWKLDTGQKVNIHVLVLLAMAGIAIMSPVKLATIKERIEYILDDEQATPIEAVIHSALIRLADRMKAELGHDAVLRYDTERKHAFITHPFFKVYLQWSLLPRFAGVYPKTKLVPEELKQLATPTISPLS